MKNIISIDDELYYILFVFVEPLILTRYNQATTNDLKTAIKGNTMNYTNTYNKQSSDGKITYIVISIIFTIITFIFIVLCIYRLYSIRNQKNERLKNNKKLFEMNTIYKKTTTKI